MSKLDDVKELVANNPGSRWWVEEILIRGRPTDEGGGAVNGAHVVIGLEVLGARSLVGPLPIGEGPKDVPMGQVLEAAHIAQQNEIDALKAKVADHPKVLDEIKKELNATKAQLHTERRRAQDAAQRAERAAKQVAAKDAELAKMAAEQPPENQ